MAALSLHRSGRQRLSSDRDKSSAGKNFLNQQSRELYVVIRYDR